MKPFLVSHFLVCSCFPAVPQQTLEEGGRAGCVGSRGLLAAGRNTWLELIKQHRQPPYTKDGVRLCGAPPQEMTRRTVSMTFSNVHNSKTPTLITLADGFALLWLQLNRVCQSEEQITHAIYPS